jgi:hypothetical protein
VLQQFGRYGRQSGLDTDGFNRLLLTHSVISRPLFAAMQKAFCLNRHPPPSTIHSGHAKCRFWKAVI